MSTVVMIFSLIIIALLVIIVIFAPLQDLRVNFDFVTVVENEQGLGWIVISSVEDGRAQSAPSGHFNGRDGALSRGLIFLPIVAFK